jgi:hypothetical protein
VSFTGTALRTEPGYAERVGLRPEQGSAELAEMGVHVAVRQEALVVSSP